MKYFLTLLLLISCLGINSVNAQRSNDCKKILADAIQLYRSKDYDKVLTSIESCLDSNFLDHRNLNRAEFIFINAIFHDNDEERIKAIGKKALNKRYRTLAQELVRDDSLNESPRLRGLPREIRLDELRSDCESRITKIDSLKKKLTSLKKTERHVLNQLVFQVHYRCYARPEDLRKMDWKKDSARYGFDFVRDGTIRLDKPEDGRSQTELLETGIENSLLKGDKKTASHLLGNLIGYTRNYNVMRKSHSKKFLRFFNWKEFLGERQNLWKIGISANSGYMSPEYIARPAAGLSLITPDLAVPNPFDTRGNRPFMVDLELNTKLLKKLLDFVGPFDDATYVETDLWVSTGPNFHVPLIWNTKRQFTLNFGAFFGYLIRNEARIDFPGPLGATESIRNLRPDNRKNTNTWLRFGMSIGNLDRLTLSINYNHAISGVLSGQRRENEVQRFIERELGEPLPDSKPSHLEINLVWRLSKRN